MLPFDRNTPHEKRLSAVQAFTTAMHDTFKVFVNAPDLPDVRVVFPGKDSLVMKYNRPAHLDSANGKFDVLEVSYDQLCQYTTGAKPFLYHEFTHQLDNLTLLPDVQDYTIRNSMLQFYTEVHAVEIELLAATRAASANITGKYVNALTPIDVVQVTVPFIHYITVEANEYVEKSKKLLASDDIIFLSFDWTYMFGRLRFAKKYSTIDTSKIFDEQLFLNYFGEEFLELASLLQAPPRSAADYANMDWLRCKILANAMKKPYTKAMYLERLRRKKESVRQ